MQVRLNSMPYLLLSYAVLCTLEDDVMVQQEGGESKVEI